MASLTPAIRSPNAPPRDEWQTAISPSSVGQIKSRLLHLSAKAFRDKLTKAGPAKVHTVLTDNGIPFAKRAEAYWRIPFARLGDALSNIGRPRSIIPMAKSNA